MEYFHAHIYYDKETLNKAKELIQKANLLDYIEVGRMHEKPVGPHPMWSCQLLCLTKDINRLIPWLMNNRDNLKVFIHPVSDDDLKDHTVHTMWLGKSVELNLNIFKK